MNLNPQAKMAGGQKFTSSKPGKDMPSAFASQFMQQQLSGSQPSDNFLIQQHHQLIGGMIGNNQQAPPGSAPGYSYKVSQAQMLALGSLPPKQ